MKGSCHGIDTINDVWISGLLQTQFHGLLTAQQQTGAHDPINGRPALQSNCQQNNFNGYTPAMLHEQLKTYNQQNQITHSCMVQPHNIHRLQYAQPHFHRQNLYGLMPTMSASDTIFGVPPTSSLQSLQELSSTVAPPSKPVKPSHPKEHPFYWRRLHNSAPVEGMTRTKDKYRVVYTEKQRTGLEKAFKEHKFITTKQRAQLTKDLDLSERQVKIWFQNRRAKERRVGTKQKTSQREEDPNYGKIEDSDNIALHSCRYSNEVTEPDFSRCRFQGSPIPGEVENFRDIGYHNQTPSSGHFRHPNTPTGWTTSSGENMMTSLNISPLTSNTDLVTYQRS